MNNIEFRIWDRSESVFLKNSGTQTFFTDWYINISSEEVINVSGHSSTRKTVKYDSRKGRFVIQQFTGICDRLNEKIYEGDLVFSPDDNETYEVVFHKGMFCVKYPDENFVPLYEFPEVLIVGNIFAAA